MDPRKPTLPFDIDLIPQVVEPGTTHFDLFAIKARITHVERQQLVLFIVHWILCHNACLHSDGLMLHIDHERLSAYGDPVISMDVRREEWQRRGPRRRTANMLAERVEEHSDMLDPGFAPSLIGELNAIRWKPKHAFEILANSLTDSLDDPKEWIARHTADHEASRLGEVTAQVATPTITRTRL